MSSPRTKRARRERARRQEGGVILIVLLVVTMMSGLAAFAAQNGTYEVRSVGGMRQVLGLRRSGESFVIAVASYLGERFRSGKGTVQPADTRWTANDTSGDKNYRIGYRLPIWKEDTSLMQVSRDDFGGLNYPLGKATIAKDGDITGVVTPFTYEGVALLERYDMPAAPGQGMGLNSGMTSGMQSYRVCVTAYSRMRVQGDVKRNSNETRELHESLGISRAYFELR